MELSPVPVNDLSLLPFNPHPRPPPPPARLRLSPRMAIQLRKGPNCPRPPRRALTAHRLRSFPRISNDRATAVYGRGLPPPPRRPQRTIQANPSATPVGFGS